MLSCYNAVGMRFVNKNDCIEPHFFFCPATPPAWEVGRPAPARRNIPRPGQNGRYGVFFRLTRYLTKSRSGW